MYMYVCTSISKVIYYSLLSLLQFLSPFFTALMAASTVEVPIFTETNLGTRMAVAVPPDITARDFKREAERVHFNCFPKSGEIMIQGLMVKRKSFFYHLPESMPMKYAFQGKRGTWFLHVEARPLSDLSRSGLPIGVATKVVEHVLYNGSKDAVYLEPPSFLTNTVQTDTRGEGKKRSSERSNCIKPSLQELQSTVLIPKEMTNKRLKKHHLLECTASEIKKGCNGRNEDTPGVTAKGRSDICPSANEFEAREGLSTSAVVKAAPSDVSSEVVSVTAIIKRYFPISNEVSSFSSPSISDIDVTHRTFQGQMKEQLKTKADDKCSSIHVDALPAFAVKTPPRMLRLQTDRTPDCLANKPGRYKVGKRLILASSNLRTSGSKQRPAIPRCRFKGLFADWDRDCVLCSCRGEATRQKAHPHGWGKLFAEQVKNNEWIMSNSFYELGQTPAHRQSDSLFSSSNNNKIL